MLIKDNKEYLENKNKLGIYLNCSGKKKKIPRDIDVIKDALSNITDNDNQFLIIEINKNFIQTILSKTKDNKKLFHVEYFDNKKNILFECKDLQNYDQTINLFKLFMFEDISINQAVNWVDSGIEVRTETAIKGFSFKYKLIWAIIFLIFIYLYNKFFS